MFLLGVLEEGGPKNKRKLIIHKSPNEIRFFEEIGEIELRLIRHFQSSLKTYEINPINTVISTYLQKYGVLGLRKYPIHEYEHSESFSSF